MYKFPVTYAFIFEKCNFRIYASEALHKYLSKKRDINEFSEMLESDSGHGFVLRPGM